MKEGNPHFLTAWYVPDAILSALYTNVFSHFSSNDSIYRWGTWVFDGERTYLRTDGPETNEPKSRCSSLLHFSILTKSWSSGLGCLERSRTRSRHGLLQSALSYIKPLDQGSLGGAAVWRLPLAQGAILETWDRIPYRAPGAWSLLLPLPMSLPLSLSLSLCDYHK